MAVTFSIKIFLRPLPEFYFKNFVVIYLKINCKDASSVVKFSCEKLKGLPKSLVVLEPYILSKPDWYLVRLRSDWS